MAGLTSKTPVSGAQICFPSRYRFFVRHGKQIRSLKLNRQIGNRCYDRSEGSEFEGYAQIWAIGPGNGNLCAGVTAGEVCPCAISLPDHLSRAAGDRVWRPVGVPADSAAAE